MRLARSVIRILPEDHGPNRPVRGQAERGEGVFGTWEDREFGALAGDERVE